MTDDRFIGEVPPDDDVDHSVLVEGPEGPIDHIQYPAEWLDDEDDDDAYAPYADG